MTPEQMDARHETREAAIRRACEVMGWPYEQKPAFGAVRAAAAGTAVAVSVEKLSEMLAAIRAARADGYREGLEAAEKVCLDRAAKWWRATYDHALLEAAAAIARLKEANHATTTHH